MYSAFCLQCSTVTEHKMNGNTDCFFLPFKEMECLVCSNVHLMKPEEATKIHQPEVK